MTTPLLFDVFTLFPDVFTPYLEASILQHARESNLVEVQLHNIRDWTNDRHHVCDDIPYGGGGGMVMKPEPIFTAVEGVLGNPPSCPLILLDPQGRVFTQAVAQELSQHSHLALLCGRYEGIDERVRQHLVTDEISIGDYVLSGGELPALVLIDAITRLIPGALGDPGGAMDDSHATGLLEYPHYTRPPVFRDGVSPKFSSPATMDGLPGGGAGKPFYAPGSAAPDLLEKADLSDTDRDYLDSLEFDK